MGDADGFAAKKHSVIAHFSLQKNLKGKELACVDAGVVSAADFREAENACEDDATFLFAEFCCNGGDVCLGVAEVHEHAKDDDNDNDK